MTVSIFAIVRRMPRRVRIFNLPPRAKRYPIRRPRHTLA